MRASREGGNTDLLFTTETSKGLISRPKSAIHRKMPKPRPLSGKYQVKRPVVPVKQVKAAVVDMGESAMKDFIMNNLLREEAVQRIV